MSKEIPFEVLINEIRTNPSLHELITQEREWGVSPESLTDSEFSTLESRMQDLNHVFSLETPQSQLFQYFILEFGDEESILLSRPDLFLARGIKPEDYIGNIYRISFESGSTQGYRIKDERFPIDKCGRQVLTDKLGVQTTFIPLQTKTKYNRPQRASNILVNIDEQTPSLRFDPIRYK
ncbi:MAG: hypothetical protein LAT82_04670 [Nanoarchaeota archaeon]|nr:hypothetical protein [Nanoarchaeota archaeon]